MKNEIRVHFWNPNGTNDIEIVSNGQVIDSMQEALFGVGIPTSTARLSFSKAIKHIAVNPMNTGHKTLVFLKKYFPEQF